MPFFDQLFGTTVQHKTVTTPTTQIPKTIDQIAQELGYTLIKKNPSNFADYLSNAAGEAIQYGGIAAGQAAQRKLQKFQGSGTYSNKRLYNIVKTNPQPAMSQKDTWIILAIVAVIIFLMRR